MAHLIRNTDKNYPCVNCGAPGNIVREGPDPRLKCTQCGFLYDASASKEAEDAGVVPDGPPKLDDTTPPLTPPLSSETKSIVERVAEKLESQASSTKIPRSPSYVFVSKDRSLSEFTTKKNLKVTTLQWETSGRKYDVFELQPKQVSAKVHIE